MPRAIPESTGRSRRRLHKENMTHRQDTVARIVRGARRRAFRLLLPLALLVGLLLGLWLPSRAAPGPGASGLSEASPVRDAPATDSALLLGAGTLSVSPSSSSIDVNGTVTLDVWINDTADLYGMDFRLCYDHAIVSLPSNNGALLWEVSDELNNFQVRNGVYASNATLCPCTTIPTSMWYLYAVTQTEDSLNPGYPLPFAGSGRLARLTFQGIVTGTTALHFCYSKGSAKDGEALWPAMLDATITVGGPTLPGDLNGDCLVDILDIMLVASHWNTSAGDPTYDPLYDLNGDAGVDIIDIMMVAAEWNQHCSG